MINQIFFGQDLGMGANKLYGAGGGIELPSQVSVPLGEINKMTRMAGLRTHKPPMHIRLDGSTGLYVGLNAHGWGRAVENLGYDRLIGSPEIRALCYGALTAYMQRNGALTSDKLTVFVGMPLEPLMGEQAQRNKNAVSLWMRGLHTWQADDQEYSVTVAKVQVTTQAAGALFDFILDDQGTPIQGLASAVKGEVGVISVGFNTIELMVVENKHLMENLSRGTTLGVRRLFESLEHSEFYSLGELDKMLRTKRLDVSAALPIWAGEVKGFIERIWGNRWRRFDQILLVGGGAILLEKDLNTCFEGKALIPDDPVMSIARGLYKLSLFQNRR